MKVGEPKIKCYVNWPTCNLSSLFNDLEANKSEWPMLKQILFNYNNAPFTSVMPNASVSAMTWICFPSLSLFCHFFRFEFICWSSICITLIDLLNWLIHKTAPPGNNLKMLCLSYWGHAWALQQLEFSLAWTWIVPFLQVICWTPCHGQRNRR